MNKIAAYEYALARIDAEKTAEAIIDAYGTSEGDMPGPYLLAYDRLEKEASLASGIKAIRSGLMNTGARIAKGAGGQAGASNIATRTGTNWKAAKGAGIGDTLKVMGGNLMQTAAQNPNAAAAAGAVGAGALGYGGYRATRRSQ